MLDTQEGEGKKKFSVNEDPLFGSFFVFVLVAVNISNVLNGFMSGAVNRYQEDIETFYEKAIELDNFSPTVDLDFHWGIIVSATNFGCLVGSLIASWLSESIGRKQTMLLNVFPMIASTLLAFFSVTKGYFSPNLFLLSRIFAGVNLGINLIVIPMYMMEISPTRIRGTVGIIFDICYGGVGYILGSLFGLTELLGRLRNWGWLFGGIIFVIPVQVLLLTLCPESPRYLFIKCKREYLARQALEKLRGHENIDQELHDIHSEAEALTVEKPISVVGLWKTRYVWKPLLIGVFAQCIQQLHGSTVIVHYSNLILHQAGFSPAVAGYFTLASFFLYLIALVISSRLIDRRGRKELLILGLLGIIFCYCLLTVGLTYSQHSWAKGVSVIGTLLSNIFSGIGPFSIPYFIVAEIFPQDSRAAAVSLCTLLNRVIGIIVISTFPLLKDSLGHFSFLLFIAICILCITGVKSFVPETKGRTFIEIFQELAGELPEELPAEKREEIEILETCL